MRLLGIGLSGINTFLGLMDLGKNMSISTYYSATIYSFLQAQCSMKSSKNHKRSARGMEVQSMLEIFARAEDLHDAKYKKYIGDGDTKTFKALSQQRRSRKKECKSRAKKDGFETS